MGVTSLDLCSDQIAAVAQIFLLCIQPCTVWNYQSHQPLIYVSTHLLPLLP